MRQERGLAESTITLRCGFVRKFFDRLASTPATLQAVRLKHVEEVLAWQGRQGYTRGSLRAYVEALRAFFRHAERRGWCASGLAAAITAPRVFREERLRSGPSWEDVQRLLASADTDRPKDIRDRAVILLLATYGFRADEVRRLRLEDFDWQQEIISVTRSKRRQAQQYPLSRVVGDAVLRYLKEVRPRVKDHSLFLTLLAPYRGLRPAGLWPSVGPRVEPWGFTSNTRSPIACGKPVRPVSCPKDCPISRSRITWGTAVWKQPGCTPRLTSPDCGRFGISTWEVCYETLSSRPRIRGVQTSAGHAVAHGSGHAAGVLSRAGSGNSSRRYYGRPDLRLSQWSRTADALSAA